MKILIIGGSEFLGRYLVADALARGHEITLFNRGVTNPGLFPEVEKLRGDRGGDLAPLRNRRWDVAIDTCGYLSSKVRSSASLLSRAVEHYTYVSSISVYKHFSTEGMDELAPVNELPDGMLEDENDDDSYGARKVLCERAAEAALPGRVLHVRAGFIVGPHAGIDRFPYWVRRAARGGRILAPPAHSPVQLIDVRDLAAWTIQMAERRVTGTFNVTGPSEPLTFRSMLEACNSFTAAGATFVWADDQFLLDAGVKPFTELPFWLPGEDFTGLFRLNCKKALATGLRFRPLAETARDTFVWDGQRDLTTEPPKRATVLAEGPIGLLPDREEQLISRWETLAGKRTHASLNSPR